MKDNYRERNIAILLVLTLKYKDAMLCCVAGSRTTEEGLATTNSLDSLQQHHLHAANFMLCPKLIRFSVAFCKNILKPTHCVAGLRSIFFYPESTD